MYREVQGSAKCSHVGRLKIIRIAKKKLVIFIPYIEIIIAIWNQKLVQMYYQYLEFGMITFHLNCSFLLTLTLKPGHASSQHYWY